MASVPFFVSLIFFVEQIKSESFIVDEITSNNFVLLTENFEEIIRFPSPRSRLSYSCTMDADVDALVIISRQNQSIISYYSNITDQSIYEGVSIKVDANLNSVALDRNYNTIYVSSNNGSVYSIDMKTRQIIPLITIIYYTTYAMKFDKNERILYLLQSSIYNTSINKYFTNNGTFIWGPALDSFISNFDINFLTNEFLGYGGTTLYKGKLNKGTLTSIYEGNRIILDVALSYNYFVLSLFEHLAIVKFDIESGAEEKNISLFAENIAIVSMTYQLTTVNPLATVSNNSGFLTETIQATILKVSLLILFHQIY